MSSTQTSEQNAWVRRVLGFDPVGHPAGASAAAPAAAGRDAVYVKSRAAWIATRAKVESDIAKLHGALSSAYQGHGAAEDLEKNFQTRVEAMLTVLDHGLAEKLDEVNKATDPGQRAQLVQQARAIMQGYEAYVVNEPLIAKLDTNPFVPVAIQKTLTATLTALSNALR
jgi:alpha-D-ribose 1-methylphosphonate 5-triphosphate synthase subunit PhnL